MASEIASGCRRRACPYGVVVRSVASRTRALYARAFALPPGGGGWRDARRGVAAERAVRFCRSCSLRRVLSGEGGGGSAAGGGSGVGGAGEAHGIGDHPIIGTCRVLLGGGEAYGAAAAAEAVALASPRARLAPSQEASAAASQRSYAMPSLARRKQSTASASRLAAP